MTNGICGTKCRPFGAMVSVFVFQARAYARGYNMSPLRGFGVAFGAAIGAITGNIGYCVAIGVSCGSGVGIMAAMIWLYVKQKRGDE